MNFLDGLESKKDGMLNFLTGSGFYKDTGKGYRNEYYSDNKLHYNRVIVYIEDGYVKAENHQEFSVGGDTGIFKEEIKIDGLTKEKVLELIDIVLPDDLG